MFPWDMLEYLQILNLTLNKRIRNTDLSLSIFSFEANLRLFVYNIKNKIINHFPWVKANVINIKEENLDEYKEKLKEFLTNFKRRFEYLKSLNQHSHILWIHLFVTLLKIDFQFLK